MKKQNILSQSHYRERWCKGRKSGIWKSYVDLNGALVTPTGVLKATSWNGPAILPRGNHPRSPPFFPDGHSEYSWANCNKKEDKGKGINPQKIILKGVGVFFEAHSLNRDLHQKARLVTYTTILLNHHHMSNFQTIHKKIKTPSPST